MKRVTIFVPNEKHVIYSTDGEGTVKCDDIIVKNNVVTITTGDSTLTTCVPYVFIESKEVKVVHPIVQALLDGKCIRLKSWVDTSAYLKKSDDSIVDETGEVIESFNRFVNTTGDDLLDSWEIVEDKTSLTFDEVLIALKEGKKVRNNYWEDDDMYIFLDGTNVLDEKNDIYFTLEKFITYWQNEECKWSIVE